MRTCSVCGVEIDKTTAYTVSGEQKAQGRRCINCVEGAAPKAKATPAEKVAAEPKAAPEAPKAPVAETAPASQPQQAASTAPHADEEESSTVKYIVGAVIVAVVIWLILG